MVRGYYTAASGALTQIKNLNMIGNNISNAHTAGFKSQKTVISSFHDHVVSRVGQHDGTPNREIGPGTFLSVAIGEYTNYTQGALEQTNIATQAAINGEGYFVVRTEKYGDVLTRNGQFTLDDEGTLILPGAGAVLNASRRPIELESGDITINASGTILDGEGEELTSLYIVRPTEEGSLYKVGEDFFTTDTGYQRADEENYQVLGGMLEKSNIDITTELTDMIAGQRNFQSCTQVIKMYDSLNEKSVNLGRLD